MPAFTHAPARSTADVPDRGAPGVGRAPIVIDVRSESEFRSGALEGALNLPLQQLVERIAVVAGDAATPIVLYCASGARSGVGCTLLRRLGYADVANAGGVLEAAARLGTPYRA
jgi:phage shock protein E